MASYTPRHILLKSLPTNVNDPRSSPLPDCPCHRPTYLNHLLQLLRDDGYERGIEDMSDFLEKTDTWDKDFKAAQDLLASSGLPEDPFGYTSFHAKFWGVEPLT